jgi:hypothetical protein
MKCTRCGSALTTCCKRGCSRCTSGFTCPRHGKDWAYKTGGGGFFSSGRSGSGKTCRKCHNAVVNCQWCKGQSGRSCSTCGGTGQTCPRDGRYWT